MGGGMPPAFMWLGGDGDSGEGTKSGSHALPPTGPDVTMTPKLRCSGTTGQEIDCTIDTGMHYNGQITPSAYRQHFAGTPIDTSVSYSVQGVGAAVANMLGRFLMVLTLDFGGERVEVSGDIWIYPNENVSCELLIGMNFLKTNKMNMRFEDEGDTIEVQGRKLPLNIIANRFYRQRPTGELAYEGSGGKMYKLGGSDIVTQNGYIMGMTEQGVHAYNARQHHITAAYCMRGHDVRQTHMEPSHVSNIEDSDEALQEALSLSHENGIHNKGKSVVGTNSEEDLRQALALSLQDIKAHEGKALQRQLLSAPSSSLAGVQKQQNLSVEDMARIVSRRAAERSRTRGSKRKEAKHGEHYYDDNDEDLDRAIAMSLQDLE